ncbi:MAG: phenylacetate--CoA ligase family protein [candidate division Zixibacteria bacterium]|nr:phenylacetate--CoA ligase family protein [candidate division Zixibacteria bacterium]
MTTAEKIYRNLPVWLHNAACSIEGWRINRRRYGNQYERIYAECAERAKLTREQLIQYRDKRLHKFVRHAYETTPYYRAKFREWNISPDDIQTLGDMELIPILTKREVQKNQELFYSDRIKRSELIDAHTSGTTGSGLKFKITRSAEREQWAVWWRYRDAHGLTRESLCGVFSGRTIVAPEKERAPFWILNYPGRQIIFSGYHLNDTHLPRYIEKIKESEIKWLHGYPSHLALLASYMIANSVELANQITHVTTGAENLLEGQREIIERAFNVRVREHYGLAEGVANLSECACGEMHVDEDFSAVEFIESDTVDGFRIIGTNFSNLAFPLLRYDTGDIATGIKDEPACSCGWGGRIVRSLDGRIEDYVVLSDGTRVGRMDHIFKDLTNIRAARIYQSIPGEIAIRIVKSDCYSKADEKKLLRELSDRLGDKARAELIYVDFLPPGRGGKGRLIESSLASAGIAGPPGKPRIGLKRRLRLRRAKTDTIGDQDSRNPIRKLQQTLLSTENTRGGTPYPVVGKSEFRQLERDSNR